MIDSMVIKDGVLHRANTVGFTPLTEGFAYGYGVFTTIKVNSTRFCYFSEHYDRLARSAEALDMFISRSKEQLLEDARSLLAVQGVLSGIIKISILRQEGGSHCMLYLKSTAAPERITEPQRVVQSDVVRYSKAHHSLHKTHNYMENIIALQQARNMGMDEAILLNENGEVTEACMSNLFIVQGEKLCTPRCSCGLLNGVARSRILELAKGLDLRVMEGTYFPQDILKATEIFLNNSVRGVIPVGEFLSKRDKISYAGDITKALSKLYMDDESRNAV